MRESVSVSVREREKEKESVCVTQTKSQLPKTTKNNLCLFEGRLNMKSKQTQKSHLQKLVIIRKGSSTNSDMGEIRRCKTIN